MRETSKFKFSRFEKSVPQVKINESRSFNPAGIGGAFSHQEPAFNKRRVTSVCE